MRFHYGAIPEDPNFHPEAEGWFAIREPGPWKLQLLAIPVAFVLMFLSLALIYLVFPRELLSVQPSTAFRSSYLMGIFVTILILIVPIHEFLHVVCQPGWGFSSKSVIGLWLSRALAYAHYEGEMSRNRFLLVFVTPYIVLGLMPIPVIAISAVFGWSVISVVTVMYVSIIGSALACGDAVCFWLVISQIPGSAVVRNQGWKTYWKPAMITP